MKQIDDSNYLVAWFPSSDKDIRIRIAHARVALNKINRIGKLNYPNRLKISFFRATVESVFLYGVES